MSLDTEENIQAALQQAEKRIERRIAEAVAAAKAVEREACAQIADECSDSWRNAGTGAGLRQSGISASEEIAATIRARSNPPKPNQGLVNGRGSGSDTR